MFIQILALQLGKFFRFVMAVDILVGAIDILFQVSPSEDGLALDLVSHDKSNPPFSLVLVVTNASLYRSCNIYNLPCR